ncbi:SAF domain-containing protein [Microbacterium sp. YJN-G]|uniref:SAF domain-containing protein n=1 Tax=Microbacterium sp. YJN-G TaxID=2763257 RepID=UPI0018785B57|nr:SAF domain-containing protein [Microbacterium sp. YJN-G]
MMHPRARRPFFGDLRFLIGLALVAVSIAGVWLLVSSSRQTTPVLQATRTVLPGESLTSADFQVVEVGLAALTETYLAPQDLDPGSIATRTLPQGELVPQSAIGDEDAARTTTVVVSSISIPEGLGAGSVVELWHAPPVDDGRSFDAPRVLVGDAIVGSIAEAEGMLSQTRTDVEVVIDRADVGDVLAAITGGSIISIIPAGAGS